MTSEESILSQIARGSSPVEPPSPSIGRGTGAALGGLVIVPVHCGELVTVVGGEAVTGVTRVTSYPHTIILSLTVNSFKKQETFPKFNLAFLVT